MVADLTRQGATSAKDQIDRLVKAMKAKSLAGLADLLGISHQAVYNARNKGKVPSAWFERVAEETGVSYDWLLYGQASSIASRPAGQGKIRDTLKLWAQYLKENKLFQQIDEFEDDITSEGCDPEAWLLMYYAEAVKDTSNHWKQSAEEWQTKALTLMEENTELKVELAKVKAQLQLLKEKARAAPTAKESEDFQESA